MMGSCNSTGRPSRSFWLLISARLSLGCCGHLVSEPADRRSLSLSLLPLSPFLSLPPISLSNKLINLFLKEGKQEDRATVWTRLVEESFWELAALHIIEEPRRWESESTELGNKHAQPYKCILVEWWGRNPECSESWLKIDNYKFVRILGRKFHVVWMEENNSGIKVLMWSINDILLNQRTSGYDRISIVLLHFYDKKSEVPWEQGFCSLLYPHHLK